MRRLPPTTRQLARAEERGDTPHSPVLTASFVALSVFAAAWITLEALAPALVAAWRSAFSQAAAVTPSRDAVSGASWGLIEGVASVALPALICVALVAAVGGGAQTQFNIATRRPVGGVLGGSLGGVSRRLTARQLGGVAARVAASVGLSALALGLLYGARLDLVALMGRASGAQLEGGAAVATRVFGGVLAGLLGVGLLDALITRQLRWRALRMTRDEIQRDQRAQQGSPEAREAHRRQRRERQRARLVPIDQVVIALTDAPNRCVALIGYVPGVLDPPHLARVALDAPGYGALVEEAAAGLIPIVEAPSLARRLHGQAQVGHPVPERFFEQLASILAENPRRLDDGVPVDQPSGSGH